VTSLEGIEGNQFANIALIASVVNLSVSFVRVLLLYPLLPTFGRRDEMSCPRSTPIFGQLHVTVNLGAVFRALSGTKWLDKTWSKILGYFQSFLGRRARNLEFFF